MFMDDEVMNAIRKMRSVGSDTQAWEVKEAVVDLPKSLLETISAFSNRNGGTIVLGLSEKNGFKPAKGFDAEATYSKMQVIGDHLTPIVRMEIEKVVFEGAVLIVARVPELDRHLKPCYITARGRYDGSFIRSGDGDRHLRPYEIDRLLETQRQPKFDTEAVVGSTVDDLNPVILQSIISRARQLFPRVFGTLSDETILIQLGVLKKMEDVVHPTLAGLLAAGIFPQKYFPRLEVVFTVFPGTTKTPDPKTGVRYLDSKELIGPIPDILMETLALVQQRMSTGAVVEGGLRRDIPDYPIVAVREAIANALQHRDYSPEGRGTHVQVNLYSDRLEITNPGGLYGATTVESLGKDGISSTRNEILSRLLTYTPFEAGYVVENKGTGFLTIQQSLADSLMPPPKVENSLTFFRLTFEKRRITKAEGMIRGRENIAEAILSELSKRTSLSVAELVSMSGLARATISNQIRALVKAGKIEPIEKRNSPKQRYRLVRQGYALDDRS